MDKADSCRRAASDAVADVEPPRLSGLVDAVLDEASMVPGALTIESATIHAPAGDADERTTETTDTADTTDTASATETPAGVDSEALHTHAAGVQLIYEGLRLTRTLAHEEPWERPTTADEVSDGMDPATADLAILAADILVARGFYLLAHTDAAEKAVQTVQAFGHDQTRRTELATRSPAAASDGGTPVSEANVACELEADTGDIDTDGGTGTDIETNTNAHPPSPTTLDTNLERDIIELAVRTGAAAVDETSSPQVLEHVDTLAARLTTTAPPAFPPVETCQFTLDPTATDHSPEECPTDHITPATDP
ncbi:hypothetical protein C483_12823 [Natrialba hulunbeirensis JCM 10989]|uniref:Uncharacterized protein n=1 Tax=Natrialba hulunbeirensis JCM 10989 TaxID=1227493 RepID=L9ZV72_9EURY|nr:hypothetical protein [Natrialba hulunbeirensis]ELY90395.1 hypothetical protein C483_12823 [Natrialba hulunbeirensis JCM 10989]